MRQHWALLGLVWCAWGCGSGGSDDLELAPVQGTVTWKGAGLADADVILIPVGKTKGGGASARTGPDGAFQVKYVRGGLGTPVGEYKVVVSRRLLPSGQPVPENDATPPADSPARESLPAHISSRQSTKLTATVVQGGGPLRLDLK